RSCAGAPPALHSFPTRRSSDLHAALAARPGCRVALDDLLPVLVADRLLSPEDADEVGRYAGLSGGEQHALVALARRKLRAPATGDRKSTRLNSSHVKISYAVFC